MKTSDAVFKYKRIALPKTLDDFYSSSLQNAADWWAQTHADFMRNHADEIFPSGNSETLLATVYAEAFPKLISQSEGGAWELVGNPPAKVQLDNDGYLQEGFANGVFFLRLKTPNDVKAADLIADSKQFMDLLLKGYPVSRPVGTDSVRVTSMGKATEQSWFTDAYQRKWQIRHWLLPYNDTVIITVALPTPDGMVMMMSQAPTGLRETATNEMESVCGFVYASYTGSLAQWRAFLADPAALPATLSNVKVRIDDGRGISIVSSRFEMSVPASVLPIDADGVLMLRYSFMRDGDGTIWDLGGVYLADSEQQQKWVGLVRQSRPTPHMQVETAMSWRSMIMRWRPWDGVPFVTTGGRTQVNAFIRHKDLALNKILLGYTMTLDAEGAQPLPKMKDEFSVLERGFKMIE
jgi:hypothetical protein